MKRFFVCALILCFTASLPHQALSNAEGINSYKDASEIPDILKMGLKRNSYHEKFIADALGVIRSNASDNKALTQEDLDKIKSQHEEKRRSSQVKKLIAYDTNYDGKVSLKDEVDQAIRSKARENTRPEHLKRMYDNIAKYDLDDDGILSYEEMATIEPVVTSSNRYGGMYNPEAYFDLDPNEDGKLTIDELEAVASKAFYTVDQDKDGIISKAEREQALPNKPVRSFQNRNTVSAACKFPEVGENQSTAFIGVYRGKAVSNLSIAGQTLETNVIPLKVDESEEDLYLVLSSFIPIIWKFEGDTSRIKKLVLVGPSLPKKTGDNQYDATNNVNSGAVGISEDKISYKNAAECGLNSAYAKNARNLSTLNQILGNDPKYYFGKYDVIGLSILDGRINDDYSTQVAESQKETPEGFNAAMWRKHLRLMPGGVIPLDQKEVLSDADVEPYKVLPKWAGIAKLVYEGAIVPINNGGSSVIINRPGKSPLTLTNIENIRMDKSKSSHIELEYTQDLKIVRPIPFYPAGLSGGDAPTFIIAKGVEPPKGEKGHSKVIYEK